MTILVIVQSRGSVGIESACLAGDLGLILGRENTLEKQMATHSSILAWRIPWTKEPGVGYRPWGCKESDIQPMAPAPQVGQTADAKTLSKLHWRPDSL